MSAPLAVLNSLGQIITVIRPDVPPGWQPPEGCTVVPEDQLPSGTPFAVPPRLVPHSVQTWALREAVAEASLTPEIEAVLDSLPEAGGFRLKARNRWEYKGDIRRDTPLFLVVRQALGWTDERVDNLFVRAAEIERE